MRLIRFIGAAVSIVFLSPPVFAQDWIEYVDRVERFGVSLPGQPAIQQTTYTSWRGTALPSRVYTIQIGPRRYSITVVNYVADKDVTDVLGSVAYAASNFRKKGGEITYDAYAQVDRIAGHELHITNPDRSQTFVMIHLYARRLYILEGTGPRALAPPVDFLQSLSILDEDGKRIRFEIDACGNRTSRVP